MDSIEPKPKPKREPTPQEVERYTNMVMAQGIQARASRMLLVRLTHDPAYGQLDPDLRANIATFLARHP